MSNQERERAASRNGQRQPYTRGGGEGQRTPAREEFRSPSKQGFVGGQDGAHETIRDRPPQVRNQTSHDQLPRQLRNEAPRDQLPRQQPSQGLLSSAALQPQETKTPLGFIPHSSQSPLPNGANGARGLRPGQSGASPSQPQSNDLAVPKPKPSSDSLNRSEYTQSFNSRPSTAASGRKTPEAPNDTVPVPEQPLPDQQLLKPRVDLEHKSADSSKFSTPLSTPTVAGTGPPVSNKSTVPAQEESTPIVKERTGYFPKGSVETPAENASGSTVMAESVVKSETPLSETELSASPPRLSADTDAEEEHRPGLGPMIRPGLGAKKSAKDVATAFRRAALAASAFQPRAGGAGARLMAQKSEKPKVGPDGINAVVPAPLLRGMSGDSARSGIPDVTSPGLESPALESPAVQSLVLGKERPLSPAGQPSPRVQIQRTATEDSLKPQRVEKDEPISQPEARPVSPDKTRSRSPARRRRQRQEADIEKYCMAIGVDAKIIDGRGGDRIDLLEELGWDGRLAEDQTADDFAANIRREIGRAQATGWLGHIEQQDEKIKDLGEAFDKVIDECEQLDQLLTLYGLEMDTLSEDVEYIEAQSQGLQVSTNNQKLLQVELRTLLQTLNISSSDLRALREASLETMDGVQATEESLGILYQAMLKIDPDIRQNRQRQADGIGADRSGIGVYADTELGQMRAVRDKKEEYREETVSFLRRLNHFLVVAFRNAEQRNGEALEQMRGTAIKKSILDNTIYLNSRQDLWMYNVLLLFVRETNVYEWKTLIGSYEMSIKNAYQEQFRDHVMACKKTARKPAGEEMAVLFNAQEEKTEESLTTRKLTIKRNKTSKPAAGARHALGNNQEGKIDAFEVFGAVLDQQAKVVAEEQNYVMAFFHLTSQSNDDFAEIVSPGHPPVQRGLPNLRVMKSYEPDREMARIVLQSMESIYGFWRLDMTTLIEWVLNLDQLQGIGILCWIERCMALYDETNQEYITNVLRKLHEKLTGLFHRFVDTQVTAIEETKVKISKRKGIISFMKTFPAFSATVESMLPLEQGHESLEVRFAVNEAYGKINKAMWESLTFIAKEPGQGGAANNVQIGADPEDKEALNYHILLIENANHYIEEVNTHDNVVLEEWKEKAVHEYHSHINLYVDAIIRRPLGKWLDFVESTETLLKTNEATNVANKPSHSRSTAKKVLAAFDLKEIRKGIETLKKRIEKHFGDADELALSRKLVEHVFSESGSKYAAAHDRMETIIQSVYEGELSIDWRKEEVTGLFKR